MNLKALGVVHVDMTIFNAPIELEIGESRSLPLLVLGRAASGKPELQFVKVYLRGSRFGEEKLREVERQFEKKTNLVSMQIQEDKRLSERLAGPMKAGKVLRLVFD